MDETQATSTTVNVDSPEEVLKPSVGWLSALNARRPSIFGKATVFVGIGILMLIIAFISIFAVRLGIAWRLWPAGPDVNFMNPVQESDLTAGDHVYTWRGVFKIYAHHGIYMENRTIINYGPEALPRKKFRKVIVSFLKTTTAHNGVHKSHEVNAFLSQGIFNRGKLYRYHYDATDKQFKSMEPGTCTTAKAGSPKEAQERAEYLLEHGFGRYHLFCNNCEGFAIYCKTGYVVESKVSAQAQYADALVHSTWGCVAGVIQDFFRLWESMEGYPLRHNIGKPVIIVHFMWEWLKGVSLHVGNALESMEEYRLRYDIGKRANKAKVSVKDLESHLSTMTGCSWLSIFKSVKRAILDEFRN